MIVECPGCESRYDLTGRPPNTRARCRCGEVFVLPEPVQRAGSLECPKCGGGVGPGEKRCSYCAAELLIKACPRCFAKIFHGAKHCDSCGAEVEVAAKANADGTARQLTCPRCLHCPEMIARLVGDTLLDECSDCHGVWLESIAVKRLVSERRQVSTDAVLGMGGPSRGESSLQVPKGRMYVKCPECDEIMNRKNFAKRSGIIIDSCRAHGTWFDADELPRIVAFVRDGGIEASQEHALKRSEENLRREKAKLRASQSSSSMLMADVPSRRASNVSAFGSVLSVVGWLMKDGR